MQRRWDIFCRVIDNFGDIGVSWRLARQLAQKHQRTVRLWVSDLTSLAYIAPNVDPSAEQQELCGVGVHRWGQFFTQTEPADVVIEAFACELPDAYITSMTQLRRQPVWINLEYLSAENWVVDYHGLPSPHPRLPLVKYFFFPGFVQGTGGLLREQSLLSARNAFDESAQLAFWQRHDIPACRPGELRISLFCYEDAPLEAMIATWSCSAVPVSVFIPDGPVIEKLTASLGFKYFRTGKVFRSGQLTMRILPFLKQADYDQLLWACDINFVRGEDSFVRAQWAGHPFIWHIYPQSDNAHQVKLDAFLELYTANMPRNVAASVRALWHGWNGNGQVNDAWPVFVTCHTALKQHGKRWAEQLRCQNDLAFNLVRFAKIQI